MKSKPVCETVLPWLRENLGERALAPLTGTDHRALAASVQIIELYSGDPDPAVLAAWGIVVRKMQPTTAELAFHAVAHVMDWDDRARVWRMAGMGDFVPRQRCLFEF